VTGNVSNGEWEDAHRGVLLGGGTEDEEESPSSEVEAWRTLPVYGSLLRAWRSCISAVNLVVFGGLALLLEAMVGWKRGLQDIGRNWVVLN
jgi:hypothetical protein